MQPGPHKDERDPRDAHRRRHFPGSVVKGPAPAPKPEKRDGKKEASS